MISSEIASLLPRCGLFRGFDDAKLGTLTAAAQEAKFASGTDIFHEGDSGDAMFVVVSGAVQVYSPSRV